MDGIGKNRGAVRLLEDFEKIGLWKEKYRVRIRIERTWSIVAMAMMAASLQLQEEIMS